MEVIGDALIEIFQDIISGISYLCSLVVSGIFQVFYALFDIFIDPIKDVCNSNISGTGSDFFDFIFDKADSVSIGFNIIYWAVGFSLLFFVLRRFIIPLCHTCIDKLVSLITPGA
jgi:hypothetical protein